MPVTSAEVLQAIEKFDAMGRDEFFDHFKLGSRERAKSYFIRHEGRVYDMKAVFRVARGQIGQKIRGPLDESGVVAGWLRTLGFEIAHHLDEAEVQASQEGGKRWIKQRRTERDPRLASKAKRRNAKKNGGKIKCQACGFEDKDPAMFDAHHLVPVSAGERKNRVKDFAVLCPTCHRWAHAKAEDRLHPLSVKEIRRARRSRKKK